MTQVEDVPTTLEQFEPALGFQFGPNLTGDQIKVLMAPLNPGRVKHRSQGSRQLSYLEAFEVKATLIRVFGFGGFDAETIETRILHQENRAPREGSQSQSRQWDVTALCTVRLTVMGRVYVESAAATQSNPELGEAADFAIKTAESDALKRAATYLGTQFGLSLYDNGSTNDIVRVLFEPTQAALLKAVREALAASDVGKIAESLNATVISEEGAGGPTEGTQDPPPLNEAGASQGDAPVDGP